MINEGESPELVTYKEDGGDPQEPLLPPYISYDTFKEALYEAADEAWTIVPREWQKRSYTHNNQIKNAFRFLGILDQAGRPTDVLRYMRMHRTIEDRQTHLRTQFIDTYSFALSLNAEKEFQTRVASEETLRKCIRFFTVGCNDLHIPIPEELEKYTLHQRRGRKKVSTPSHPRGIEVPRKAKETLAGEKLDTKPQSTKPRLPIEILLQKFPEFDPTWPTELQTRWFTGFEKLMSIVNGEMRSAPEDESV